MSLQALGGGELMGDKLVRYVYLDESGIGDPSREPYVVVAGVIVHADLQLKAIEKYLHDMIADFVRPQDRDGFSFHAKHLFNGGGIFHRNVYPKELRHKILLELCTIPKEFDLPVVMGFVERKDMANKYPQAKPRDVVIAAQSSASTACLIGVERYMREPSRDHEVATLVYENNDQARKYIRSTHNYLKGLSRKDAEDEYPGFSEYLPLERIAETAFFSEKSESSILQVADAVVFAINRKLRLEDGCDYLFSPIDSQLILRAKAFGSSPASASV